MSGSNNVDRSSVEFHDWMGTTDEYDLPEYSLWLDEVALEDKATHGIRAACLLKRLLGWWHPGEGSQREFIVKMTKSWSRVVAERLGDEAAEVVKVWGCFEFTELVNDKTETPAVLLNRLRRNVSATYIDGEDYVFNLLNMLASRDGATAFDALVACFDLVHGGAASGPDLDAVAELDT